MAKKMNKKAISKKTDDGSLGGFTIIEVVLVLAIAGLIFMMVFIALPALQRSQRDTQRRENIGRVTQAIMNYETNNNGRLPATGSVDPFDRGENGGEGRAMSEITCSRTEGGATQGGAGCLLKGYLNSTNATNNEFSDPLGWDYGLEIADFAEEVSLDGEMDYTIYIYKGARCDGEFAVKSSNSRDYAIMYRMEGSGTYCRDNGSGSADGGGA